jgi:parallel beta-helix repeat protein
LCARPDARPMAEGPRPAGGHRVGGHMRRNDQQPRAGRGVLVLLAAVGASMTTALPLRGGGPGRGIDESQQLALRGAALNAVDDFGASGQCVSNATHPSSLCVDDHAALQRAVDAAQKTRRALFIPAGSYAISAPLIIHSNANKSELVDGNYIYGPLKLFGEGKYITTIGLSTNASAVVYMPVAKAPSVDAADSPTTLIEISSISLQADYLADYTVLAPGLTRSRFSDMRFGSARLVGLSVPYGWINRVEDCRFTGNGWGGGDEVKGNTLAGAIRMNYANNLDIINSNFEGNGYGIFIGGGESIRITGNDIEGTGGPGVHITAASGVTIADNYFESECDSSFGGPLVLRPLAHLTSGANLTVEADIVLNGIPSDGK